MNKEIAKQWVEALRSGKYIQTHGALRNSKDMCCLGVLCDIIDPTRWVPPLASEGHNPDDSYGYRRKNDGMTLELGVLAHDIKELVDMKDPAGGVFIENEKTSLSVLNDRYKTFSQIADIIEQQVENL